LKEYVMSGVGSMNITKTWKEEKVKEGMRT